MKAMQKHHVLVLHESDSSGMEMEEKSMNDSLERGESSVRPLSEASRDDITSLSSLNEEEKSLVLTLPEASRYDITSLSSSNDEEKKTIEESENEEKRITVSHKGRIPEAKKRKVVGSSMSSDDKENEIQLNENDDKENSSAPCENM
jgi:hypothetical protein